MSVYGYNFLLSFHLYLSVSFYLSPFFEKMYQPLFFLLRNPKALLSYSLSVYLIDSMSLFYPI